MRVAVKIELSEADRKRLGRWSRSRCVAVRLQERSRIVLMAADGVTNKAIAEALGTDQNKVGRWRRRFAEEGVEGSRRSGRGAATTAASARRRRRS